MDLSEQLDLALNEMSARKVLKKLRKVGCKILRQKGSHVQVSCGPGRQSTVPKHGSKDIATGTLKAIEKSLEIDIDGDGRPDTKKVS
jgi:predicted RNA binding protein YcfA (HicA-like mRNA interferase family)